MAIHAVFAVSMLSKLEFVLLHHSRFTISGPRQGVSVTSLILYRPASGTTSINMPKASSSLENDMETSLSIEKQQSHKETSHTIGQDSWLQMGFVLLTGVTSAFILGYSKLILASLGWIAGMLGLALGAAISLYANCLLASLHYLDGKRHIRYRDLANHIYGRNMYLLTWALQYSNLFTINIGFVILAGQALKGFYMAIRDNDEGFMKLPHWIAVVGVLCFAFAFFIPHLSALRAWLLVSTAFTIVYVVIVLVGSIEKGLGAPPRNYGIQGTTATKTFSAVGALVNIAFSYNTGILPELQATLTEPAVRNMKKALYFQFAIGCPIMFTIVAIGYWAFGSAVSAYLLNDIDASKTTLAIANLSVLCQTVISLHIFASPMYELVDTKFGRLHEPVWSIYNSFVRFTARGSYLLVTTFIAACLPFLGDFTNLTGALSTLPLTFVLANHMYLTVNWEILSVAWRAWHWFNVLFFSLLALFAAISAVRLIVVNSSTYSAFADL